MVEIYKVKIYLYLKAKGIDHDDAVIITETLAKNSKVWVDVMMVEELGIMGINDHPEKDAIVTFFAFTLFGLMPSKFNNIILYYSPSLYRWLCCRFKGKFICCIYCYDWRIFIHSRCFKGSIFLLKLVLFRDGNANHRKLCCGCKLSDRDGFWRIMNKIFIIIK